MKTLRSILTVFVLALGAYAQSDERAGWLKSIVSDSELSNTEHKNRITKYDFSPLWTRVDNSSVFGIIGNHYQRLRIKIVSATKLPTQSDTYTVTGKTMVKNVIRSFSGTMKITNARAHKTPRPGLDDEYKNKRIKASGVTVGKYHFSEDRKKTNTGYFAGVFATYWYIDRNGRLKYDDIETYSDSYLNNQFVGTWTFYRNKDSKIANWGNHRIPLSGDLDGGARRVLAYRSYLQYGWQSYRDAYFNNDPHARKEEEKQWWR